MFQTQFKKYALKISLDISLETQVVARQPRRVESGIKTGSDKRGVSHTLRASTIWESVFICESGPDCCKHAPGGDECRLFFFIFFIFLAE